MDNPIEEIEEKAEETYEEWIEKIRSASGLAHEKEQKEDEKESEKKTGETVLSEKNQKSNLSSKFILILIFMIALLPRLYFLFFVSGSQNAGPGWYGDVYHHWQIAYLSKEVGFSHGFLRLWDLKGMEFFWGLMHPLILSILFTLTGSVDILIPRLLSVFGGSLVAVFVFLLVKRYFNTLSAVFAAIWVAFFPVVLFSDTLGMQEQLGLVFLLGGILLWPRKALLSGILWAFASMVRSEYWIFAAALTFAAFLDRDKKASHAKFALGLGYFLPIILYMKYLITYTNNPIFPIWWNYLASVVGDWFTNLEEPLTDVQIQGQWIGRGIFLAGLAGFLFSFIKRKKYSIFFLLGFSNIMFIGFIFGFAAYVHGFFDRFWVDRLLSFPYLFFGVLLSVFLFYYLPLKAVKAKRVLHAFGALLFLSLLLFSQISWGYIMRYFSIAQAPFQTEVEIAKTIAKYNPEGKMLFPAGRPALTYALVRNHKISGKKLISEMYDPFFYASPGEPVAKLDKKVFSWFEKENIQLIIYTGKKEYLDLIGRHPLNFRKLEENKGTVIYEFLR